MTDEKLALLRATRNNIHRYRRLLQTHLTDLERAFLQKRLSEEEAELQTLMASTFPITLGPLPENERVSA